jgi:cobalt-zinc-cadmium efflux system membrane fusion protein
MKFKTWKLTATIGSVLVVGVLIVLAVRSIHADAAAQANSSADPESDPFKLAGEDVIETTDEAIKTSGIKTMTVQTSNIPVTLTLTARSGLNMENVSHVHAQFGGKVTQVTPELGAMVKGPQEQGGPTVLCIIASNDLAQAKSNYLQARVQLKLDQENLGRTKELVKSTVLADKFLLDAESAVTKDAAVLEAARQQLLVFGLTQKDIDQVDNQQGRQRMDYVITSPRSGVVAEKGVAGGEIADPTMNLFTVADTSTMWVWGDVYERDLRRIKVGEPIKIVFTSDPEHPRQCKVDWISPVLDPNTHSIRIRGLLDNKDGHLLADMYGTMLVTVDTGKNSMLVPADCVIRKGDDAYVFVALGSKEGKSSYKRVKVMIEPVDVGFGVSDSAAAAISAGGDSSRTGASDATRPLRIVGGIKPGDVIVSSGALGLFTEIEQQVKK